MGAGSLTLAWLLLAAPAADPADTVYMNTRGFQIPITIKPERRGTISALELHMSKDRGQSWEQFAKATPDQSAFDVTMPGDGHFWFTIVVVDTQGRKEPVNLQTAEVGLRVIVDTTPPSVKLTAERQGDEVVASWEIRDDNLDPRTLKLEWQQGNSLPVVAPLPSPVGPKGQTRFKPADPAAVVSLRMSAQDMAKNEGQGPAEVAAVSPAPPGITLPQNTVPPIRPPVDPPPPARDVVPQPVATAPGSVSRTTYASAPTSPVSPPPGSEGTVATSVNPGMPAVQVINRRQVKVEFAVAKYGPTGLGGVDVYLTTDDGRSWIQSKLDPGAWSLPPSVTPGAGPLRGSVTVQLEKEGVVYGIYLIVKSKSLLGKPPPRSGDAPQLRVEVDTTAPFAQLGKPEADTTQPNTVIMTWSATDAHMAPNPITLEWAPKKDGPWQFIGSPALPNTGRYNWQITPDVPPSVFLRLTVRDVAGNVAIAETATPELIDLTIPDIAVDGVKLQEGAR
jgi:hypothetical protein